MSSVERESASVVRHYHERSKHRLEAYAAGPETLDWDAQPAPFRRFEGAPVVSLPLLSELPAESPVARALATPFDSLGEARPPIALSRASLGALLQSSLGITAWKSIGPDRWAVRANPSSGNLHPVEAYVLLRGVAGLADGLYHYEPEHHVLELRARGAPPPPGREGPRVDLALTTVMWREAWKYGERAFRYCQLDVGHAMAALRYAAALFGWRLAEQVHVGSATLARALGLDRAADFAAGRRADTEREEPEVLLSLSWEGEDAPPAAPEELERFARGASWHGTASLIDARPMYRWPVVTEIANATRRPDGEARAPASASATSDATGPRRSSAAPRRRAGDVILERRSAQRFDAGHVLDRDLFFELLDAALPRRAVPWDVLAQPPRIELVLFVHRVSALDTGVYWLNRRSAASEALRARFEERFQPSPVPGAPPQLDLVQLMRVDPKQLARVARTVHCHQDIAATSCFAVGMLADVASAVSEAPSAYRDLYREAGVLGQVLYLEAEARELRGTGIGCFFDDPFHELLGLEGHACQSLYHFTVGKPKIDPRVETAPPYAPRPTHLPGALDE